MTTWYVVILPHHSVNVWVLNDTSFPWMSWLLDVIKIWRRQEVELQTTWWGGGRGSCSRVWLRDKSWHVMWCDTILTGHLTSQFERRLVLCPLLPSTMSYMTLSQASRPSAVPQIPKNRPGFPASLQKLFECVFSCHYMETAYLDTECWVTFTVKTLPVGQTLLIHSLVRFIFLFSFSPFNLS